MFVGLTYSRRRELPHPRSDPPRLHRHCCRLRLRQRDRRGRPRRSPPPEIPPNVLVIVMDTLRADALGAYGQARPTSPVIDKLASESVVLETAWTQYTWSPSLLRFLHDLVLGAHPRLGLHRWASSTPTGARRQDADHGGGVRRGRLRHGRTIANMHLKEELGFGRGFDSWELGSEAATLRRAVADIGNWKRHEQAELPLRAPHGAARGPLPTPEVQAAIGVTVASSPRRASATTTSSTPRPSSRSSPQAGAGGRLPCLRSGR